MSLPAESESKKPSATEAIIDESRARRTKERVKTVALVIAIIGAVVYGVTDQLYKRDQNTRLTKVSNSEVSTLGIVQRVTDPRTEAAQVNAFLSTNTAIFRLDCDAKAHQFAIQDFVLQRAATPTDHLSMYQSACSEIQPPRAG